MLHFGYNTNGFAHHRLTDALAILADLGYRAVALTLDHHVLNPYDADLPAQITAVRRRLQQLGLHCVIETGARFLLDPWRKHQPTLLSADPAARAVRLDFLCRAADIAHELQAEALSFWSGAAREEADPTVLLDRLVEGCRRLCDHTKVPLAFEPEPGMFIDGMDDFALLQQRLDGHPAFGLTIDIGHLHCQGEVPISAHLERWASLLWNIHIEDMCRGVHDHLMFGEGEIDFPPVLRTLHAIGYQGGVYVELSRHSHDAVETARRALAFLKTVADASGS